MNNHPLSAITIKGNRVLLGIPEVPLTDLADIPKPQPDSPIFIPDHFLTKKDRKASEWVILKLGTSLDENGNTVPGKGRSGTISDELQVGQHVIVNHIQGWHDVLIDGRKARIMSSLDILCVLQQANE
jgi:co-chaperonin GroES (HSP10)